jgi:hypothetical protein
MWMKSASRIAGNRASLGERHKGYLKTGPVNEPGPVFFFAGLPSARTSHSCLSDADCPFFAATLSSFCHKPALPGSSFLIKSKIIVFITG